MSASLSLSPSTSSEPGGGDGLRVGFVMHQMQVAGAEKLVESIVEHLRGEVTPAIYCLDRIGELGEDLKAKGIRVVSLDRRPGLDLSVARRLATEIRRDSIQVIHAHQYTPFFYAALARLIGRGGFRIIFTEHGRHFPDIVSWRRRWINRLLLAGQAAEVNACSEFSCRALVALDGFGGRAPQVIRNGVAASRYRCELDRALACRQLGLRVDRRYVSAIARFHPVKDHRTLVQGFAIVARQLDDTDLLLAGGGALQGEIEALAGELGCRERVRFLGVLEDVRPVLWVSDVFCLTSLSEAASLTILEAMASGLPVVATEVGGNPEMIEHEVEGLLVPRQDPGRVAEALSTLLSDAQLARRLGEAGRRKVESLYELDQTIEAYARLYRALAPRQSGVRDL